MIVGQFYHLHTWLFQHHTRAREVRNHLFMETDKLIGPETESSIIAIFFGAKRRNLSQAQGPSVIQPCPVVDNCYLAVEQVRVYSTRPGLS